jgi:hypothetical protein
MVPDEGDGEPAGHDAGCGEPQYSEPQLHCESEYQQQWMHGFLMAFRWQDHCQSPQTHSQKPQAPRTRNSPEEGAQPYAWREFGVASQQRANVEKLHKRRWNTGESTSDRQIRRSKQLTWINKMGKLEKHWGKDSNAQVRRCEEDEERKEVKQQHVRT